MQRSHPSSRATSTHAARNQLAWLVRQDGLETTAYPHLFGLATGVALHSEWTANGLRAAIATQPKMKFTIYNGTIISGS